MVAKTKLAASLGIWCFIALFAIAVPPCVYGGVRSVQRNDRGVTVDAGPVVLAIEPCSPSVVHVRIAREKLPSADPVPTIVGKCAPGPWTLTQSPAVATVKLSSLTVEVDMKTGALRFADSTGQELLREASPFHLLPPAANASRDGLAPSETFVRSADERFFGLGVVRQQELNAANSKIALVNRNTQIRVPLLYSSRGYGLLWNNPSHGALQLTPQTVTWSASAGEGIDFYLIGGPSADQVIASYRMLTGDAPLLPRWAYGFWFSRNRFQSQKEVLDVAQSFKDHNFALDAMLQDYFYWAPTGAPRGGIGWGSHEFVSDRYPDPKAMVDSLHRLYGVHFLPVVWAKFNPATANGRELEAAGALFPTSHDWAGPEMRYYDPFVKQYRDLYGKQLQRNLFSLGSDGLWLDGAEPEIEPRIFESFSTPQLPASRVANAFPLMHTTAAFDAMRSAEPEKRVVLLPRSAWAGEQRNGAIVWTGDVSQDWKDFRWQLEGLQNFSIAGIPYITTDVGGYQPRPQNDSEQFVRWYQWGTFCPIFRVHGLERGLPWQYGEAAEVVLRDYDNLRHRLMPYIYSQANDISTHAGTLMRPLVMDFRTDKQAIAAMNEFMFGPAFLAAPITESRYTELPPNAAQWTDARGHAASLSLGASQGDKWVTLPANLELASGVVAEPAPDPALATGAEIAFRGSFTPESTGKIYLRFIARKAGSRATIAGHTYRQAADFEYLTVPVDGQKGVPVPFTFTTQYQKPAFRVLQDNFADGKVTRSVYLPPAATWYDFWSGARVAAGAASVSASLPVMPLYVRGGSIVPLALPDPQPSTQAVELRVYRGADGSFRLYDDSGDGYAYQGGQRTVIPIAWNEAAGTLTFSARQGSYPGMPASTVFHIVWVGAQHGAGIQPSSTWDTTVTYTGAAVSVRAGAAK